MEGEFRYRGRVITAAEVEFLCQLITQHPGTNRRQLSLRRCEAWGWRQANGALRDMVCRGLLLELARAGHLVLPAATHRHRNPSARRATNGPAMAPILLDTTPLEVSLRALRPVEFQPVRRTPEEPLFHYLVGQYHPLGYIRPVAIRLWFTNDNKSSSVPSGDRANTITLSEAFYSEIDQHRVPMEREVVIGLANSPGLLDFYIWIAWRSWVLRSGRTYIPLFSPGGLRDQLGCQIHPEGRFLRHKINQWLRVIRAYWPQCPAEISSDGQHLIISSSKTSPALHPVQMPATA